MILKKPRFIVLEGLDGSGKSTQAARLANEFEAVSLPCYTTFQPSKNPIGELVRAATKDGLKLENETMALLFAADFYQHYHDTIAPNLKNGVSVICDRYYYSNAAYQGADSASLERILKYNQYVMSPTKRPDAVFFLDVPPDECMRRITATRTEISIFETLEQQKRLRERFLYVFSRLKGENIIIIEAGNLTHEAITSQIWEYLMP